MSDKRPFVKSRDTSTPAVNSRSAVDKMLRRYGAAAISMSENIERKEILVSFVIPDSPAEVVEQAQAQLGTGVQRLLTATTTEHTNA